MISVIYGSKGTGKTQRIINAANTQAEHATGKIVFIKDNGESLGIAPNIKFVNLTEYKVKSEDEFIGFLKGMLAADFDIQSVYIDGLSRLLSMPPEDLKPIFDTMSEVSKAVEFTVTVSADKLPAYLKPFAAKN